MKKKEEGGGRNWNSRKDSMMIKRDQITVEKSLEYRRVIQEDWSGIENLLNSIRSNFDFNLTNKWN